MADTRVELKRFQEIADSPTVRYYTDWRKFRDKLDIDDAVNIDNIEVEADSATCIIDLRGSYALATGNCGKIGVARDHILFNPALATNKEYMLDYHARRAKVRLEAELPDKSKVLVISRGGDGYTGYSLKLSTPAMSTAQVTIIDVALGDGLKTQCIALEAGDRSKVETILFQKHAKTPVYTYMTAYAGIGAELQLKLGTIAGDMTRTRIDTILRGETAAYTMHGGAVASGENRGDIIANVVHSGQKTRSTVQLRGVSSDKGVLALRGVARVEPNARGSSTGFEAYVIPFGDKAKGYAVPMLEIFTGDVEQAYHSAAASSLDEETVFYLKTRGIGKEIPALLAYSVLDYTGVGEAVERFGLNIDKMLWEL